MKKFRAKFNTCYAILGMTESLQAGAVVELVKIDTELGRVHFTYRGAEGTIQIPWWEKGFEEVCDASPG